MCGGSKAEAARLSDPAIDEKDSDVDLLRAYRSASVDEKEASDESGLYRLSEDKVLMPGGRVLEDSPVVDLLVLYTAQAAFGTQRSSEQMETNIVASYQEANDGLAASGVDFTIRIVHMQQVNHQHGAVDAVYDLQENQISGVDVHALRDETGADLVQLVGLYDDTCGIG